MTKTEAKEYAAAMVFSVYPTERELILRIMQEKKLKSTFDVVRLLAKEAKKSGFNPVRFRY